MKHQNLYRQFRGEFKNWDVVNNMMPILILKVGIH